VWMDEGVDMDVDEGVYMTCVAKMYVHAYNMWKVDLHFAF